MSSGQFHIVPCADEAMLERLLALNDGFIISAASMSAEALRARFERCPTAFHCVLHSSELVGFFILLPVNEACSEALGGGLVTAGRHIRLSDLVEPGGKIAAMYLSVVCAVGPRAQRAVIEGVIAALRRFYSSEGVRLLFARAATETGARMLARLSGTPFEPDGRIHSIDLGQYEVITAPC
jgi:hypothetical protein